MTYVYCPRCDRPFLSMTLMEEHLAKHKDHVKEEE